MNTKYLLLEHIHSASESCDRRLNQLFTLMTQAVMRNDAEEIDWHLMNDMSESDVLLIIVLTNIKLTIQYDELILRSAVDYVMSSKGHQLH
ncbi:hypothetical protein A6E07_11500 [Vibrio cyclitrophicus]|uniref:hypothetical protein n=1 Tax=Vibrio cortegadensis TaxID=1328770 RepID=UPI00080E8168|nr:hypothetical protein A6E07_11500 [Vibrio cyclitrophicus]